MTNPTRVNAPPLVIVTELTVANVKFGGNKADGKYFFAFDNRSISVPQQNGEQPGVPGTPLRFTLSDVTAPNFVITGLVSSDAQNNLVPASRYIPASKRAREIEVVNTAKTACIFNIGVLVTDLTDGTLIVCDPQVTNTPDEGP
jgi:hypothetical protein